MSKHDVPYFPPDDRLARAYAPPPDPRDATIAALTASLARVTAERDELLRERDIAFHPEKHCMVPLAAMKELSDQRDALRASLAGAEKALKIIDNNRGSETEDAYVLYRKLVNSANTARSALTPPPTKEAP